jgi:hypothetical protein
MWGGCNRPPAGYWALAKREGVFVLRVERAYRRQALTGFEWWVVLEPEFCFDQSMNYGKDDCG